MQRKGAGKLSGTSTEFVKNAAALNLEQFVIAILCIL
jgi:hypothetical protein